MPKINFIFSFLFTSLLFLSCRKENYHQLLRSENKLASANGNQAIVYSIHTEMGTIIDLYRDLQGYLNIYKAKSGSEPHDIKLTIQDASGQVYPFSLSYLSDHPNRNTHIKGPIKVLRNQIIVFEEEKNNTSTDAIYTIKSELTSVDICQKRLSPPPTMNGKPAPHRRSRTHSIITISNQKPGSKLSATLTNLVIKSTDGKKLEFSSDYVAAIEYLETDLHGDLASVSVDGIYIYHTTGHTVEKREMQNNPCSTNIKEEIVYDINTASYPAPSPVGSGIFSIRRTMDGQIFMYQENKYGLGNSSVQYEIIATNYEKGALMKTESLTFNENVFSSYVDKKIDTKLTGLITVKRNGVILFDESEEIKKEIANYPLCTADFLPNHESSTNSHHITRRGVGAYFYPMPEDGSPVVLKVKFIISKCPNDFRKFIMDTVKEWEKYAHVEFHFLDDSSTEYAQIRINVGTGSPNDNMNPTSLVGTKASTVALDYRTMQLPLSHYQNNHIKKAIFRRIVLHEFGHALGLEHEHQNPKRQFQWNKAAIYKDLSLRGVSRESVDKSIFAVIDGPESSNSGQYDPHSIMNYAFAPALTFGSSACPPASDEAFLELSAGDKAFIAKMYPASYCVTPQCTKNNEQQPKHKPKPDFTDTTNEPPGPESSNHWVKPRR